MSIVRAPAPGLKGDTTLKKKRVNMFKMSLILIYRVAWNMSGPSKVHRWRGIDGCGPSEHGIFRLKHYNSGGGTTYSHLLQYCTCS
jgi:hypothetical protein